METQISKYIVLDKLGKGGSGEVFLVCDRNTDIYYAMKRFVNGFAKKEADILKNLNHPRIPKLHDFFEEGDASYIVMEYEEGCSLSEIIHNVGKPGTEEYKATGASKKSRFQIAVQTAEILKYLHTLPVPVVHGDLKPENIIRTKGGAIKLIDFGSAHTVAKEIHEVRSTKGFAAPEMEHGLSTTQSDIYAFGMLFIQLMTGKSFVSEKSNKSGNHYVTEKPYAPEKGSMKSSISRSLLLRMGLNRAEANIAIKCIQPRERLRYHSAKELLNDLRLCERREKNRRKAEQIKSFICTDIGGVSALFGLFAFFLKGSYRGKYCILFGCILLLINLVSESVNRMSGAGEYQVMESVFLNDEIKI